MDAVATAPQQRRLSVRLQSNDVIVLGAWNPAIVQPDWLSERKVVESSTPESLSANPLTKGFFFKMDNVNWIIDEQRLQIWGAGGTDTGVFAARVLSLLSHTPVQAIGTNFHFQTGVGEWPSTRLPKLGDWTLETSPTKLQFKQFTWVGTRKMGSDTSCQITLTHAEDALSLNVNLHRDADAVRAAQFAGAWRQDWQAVREIISDIFEVHADA